MIGFYLHHHGSGHRVRGTLLARALDRPVTGLGTGGAPDGWPGDWVELGRDDDGAVVDPTAGGTVHWAPAGHAGLRARMGAVSSWVAGADPALLVVDVSVEVALLARLHGVRCVVTAMPGDRSDRPHRLGYDLAEALLAPWPEAAHPAEATGWPAAWTAKTWHVGGISRFTGRDPGRPDTVPAPTGRRALMLLGGGGTDLDGSGIAALRAATPGWDWVVRGGPEGPSPDLWSDLLAADVVVVHAGQNAVADVAAARRPAVVVAQDRPHGEQRATVAALDRLGIGVPLPQWPAPEAWPGLLDQARERGGQAWARWDAGGGAVRAARLLSGLADRAGGGS